MEETSSKEEIRILSVLLNELKSQLTEDISVFSTSISMEYSGREDMDDDDELTEEEKARKGAVALGMYKSIHIEWSPRNKQDHPYKDVENCRLVWEPIFNTVTLTLDARRHHKANIMKSNGRHYRTFHLQKQLPIKKMLIDIHNRIDKYQKEEVPLKELEDLNQDLYDIFPHLMTANLLDVHDEEV